MAGTMALNKGMALMRTDYPILTMNPTMKDVEKWLNRISQLRGIEDLPDYTNQKNIYISGRSTTRVPSGHTNVIAGDRVGDMVFATDASYVYYLVDKSGTLVWARVALDTAW